MCGVGSFSAGRGAIFADIRPHLNDTWAHEHEEQSQTARTLATSVIPSEVGTANEK